MTSFPPNRRARGASWRFAIAAILALLAPDLSAWDEGLPGFPECSIARSRHFDAFQGAPVRELLAFKPRAEASDYGPFSLYPVKRADGAFAVFAAPGSTASTFARGTWIVKRDSASGAFPWVKVFLAADPGVYAILRPSSDERTRLDIVVHGGVLFMDVPIAIPFLAVLRRPFAEVVRASADSVDWTLFAPDPALYHGIRTLVGLVRPALRGLRYSDDGALDPSGRPIRIADGSPQVPPYGLNCSGFALWLADGITYPVSGTRLSWEDMRRRRNDDRWNTFAMPWEETLDPWFGLDWAINIARAAGMASRPGTETRRDDVDVVIPAFARYSPPRGAFEWSRDYGYYPSYFRDSGYQIRGLKSLLWLLAIREPGRFYLASVSRRPVRDPAVRRYFHVAALFPFFDEGGVFRVAVFESAAETSIDSFVGRYSEDTYAHLVRLDARPRFEPLPFPAP